MIPNSKRKYKKFVTVALVFPSSLSLTPYPFWQKMDRFQIWYSCRWLFLTPSFTQHFTHPRHHSINWWLVISLLMANVPLTQKFGNFFELTKWVKKYLWESDIFGKDVARWSVYLFKTSLFRRCFSNILLAEINYLTPKLNFAYKTYNLTLQLTFFATYGYRDKYWDKVFVSFIKIVSWKKMVQHQIFVHWGNLNICQTNNFLFQVRKKDSDIMRAIC